MIISIGDIVNELLKYSNSVETRIVGSTPVIKAFLAQTNSVTRAYLYIAQVSDTTYTAYADIFDNGGYRLIPTGFSSMPFIREIEQVKNMMGGSLTIDERFSTSVENVSYQGLIDFIYELLIAHRILAVNRTTMNSKIVSFNINNPKLVRSIEKTFISNGKREGTIRDMYNIVIRDKGKFVLNEVKTKDRKMLTQRLAERGVDITINGDKITDVSFKRR